MPTLRTLTNTGTATWSNGVPTTGATAITTTCALGIDDSGGIFTVTQVGAGGYTITLPQPTGPGIHFYFQLVGAAANTVRIVATGSQFEGNIVEGTPDVDPAANVAMNFVTGAAAVGDSIEVISTSTTRYFVRAFSSGNNGITCTA